MATEAASSSKASNGALTPPPSPGSARPSTPNSLSRTYRNATSLFLTRRLPDSLAMVTPLLPSATPSNRDCPPALRVKIWSLYLAILDAAARATPDEGRNVWGSNKWKGIVKLVKGQEVWEEVLHGGFVGDMVDPEILCALVMLNLSHCQTQTGTQTRIEDYLATAPPLDDSPENENAEAERAQRLRILELYILHVLPRNNEWGYAREFTQFCTELLDTEKESFLRSLNELEKRKKEEEEAAQEAERIEQEALEKEKARQAAIAASLMRPKPAPIRSESPPKPKKVVAQTTVQQAAPSSSAGNGVVATPANNNRPPTRAPPLISRVLMFLHKVSSALKAVHAPFDKSSLTRTILILVAFIWAGSKREVRIKVARLLRRGATSVARTVGMGVKVSYI